MYKTLHVTNKYYIVQSNPQNPVKVWKPFSSLSSSYLRLDQNLATTLWVQHDVYYIHKGHKGCVLSCCSKSIQSFWKATEPKTFWALPCTLRSLVEVPFIRLSLKQRPSFFPRKGQSKFLESFHTYKEGSTGWFSIWYIKNTQLLWTHWSKMYKMTKNGALWNWKNVNKTVLIRPN